MTFTITRKHIITAVVVILVIASVGASIYFYTGYRKTQSLLKNPTLATQEDNKKLIEAVSKLVDVPTDEEPTIAAVSDADKLRNQPFFAKAANDDRVILYPSVQRAILYRPSTGKIIEMSIVNTTAQNGEGDVASAQTIVDNPPSPEPVKSLKATILNGTTVAGLASKAQDDLTAKYGNIEILGTDNAARQDYTQTLVVDLNGENEKAAADAAALFNGAVKPLPEGEAKPLDADILIILGSSYSPEE